MKSTTWERRLALAVWLVVVGCLPLIGQPPSSVVPPGEFKNNSPKIILPTKDSKVVVVGSVVKLTKGMRYVIQADVRCDLVTFPEGLVTVQSKTGPREWTGIFAGGTGDYEDKTFDLPFIYALAASPSGKQSWSAARPPVTTC